MFGIPPKDLSIAQSAYLIGLLQSPYGYTPYEKDGTLKSDKDLKYSIQRQHYVLKRMLIEDQITEKEYNDALKYDIKSHLLNRKSVNWCSLFKVTTTMHPNIKNSSKIIFN